MCVPVVFFVLVMTTSLTGMGICPLYAQEGQPRFDAVIRSLIARHCIACHGDDTAEEGLNLQGKDAKEPAQPLRDLQSLEKIAERLRSQTMPPEDADEPLSSADRSTLLSWIDGQIERNLGGKKNLGRVAIRRLTKTDYRNTVRDLLGVEVDTENFPSDDVAHGFDNLAEVISLPPLLMERYANAAESIAQRWYEQQIANDPAKQPSDERTARELAVSILLPLQDRAFRRPTTELERHWLLTFFDQCQQNGFSYAESMRAGVMRILISPAFLYRIEKDGPIGQDRRLDDFELATRLSYFIWSSMPDGELFELARRGELQQGDNVAKQVQRMLKDEKVRTGLVENFAGQWLQTRRLAAIRPDEKAFPNFDEELRKAMEAETLRVFETIVREDRPITELLDADYTYVNERLARHYGIDGIHGQRMQRVNLEDLPRRGVLTHAGLLAINAHPTRTSPVLRGKWILEAILGTPPPPPPADVPELEAVKVEGALRERLEAHRSNARCASCHKRMDTLGLAFENYDAVGAWRAKDAGAEIDPSGALPDVGEFDNAVELIALLRERQASTFRENVVEQMMVYALGRTLTMYDRLPKRRIITQAADEGDRFSALVNAIVASDPFRLRRNPGRIGVEKLAEHFIFELTGNPDQQAVLKVHRNPHNPAPADVQTASFELHALKPLLGAGTDGASNVQVGKAEGGPKGSLEAGEAYRYPITAPLGEPIYLSFLEGMISPQEYSDDFLKPIQHVPESDESRVVQIANSSHKWNGSLTGPDHIRPGSLVAFDFDVRLVAKDSDNVHAFLATAGASNQSMFENAGGFQVVGEGTHRLRQVCRRKSNMLDAWNNVINLVIRTRTQTVIGNVSPLHVIRPQLGVSDQSPISFGPIEAGKTAESPERRIFNAQKATLMDHHGEPWKTILYGTARLTQDEKRAYVYTSDQTGAMIIGEHADLFGLVGDRATEDGRAVKLIGDDEQPGLTGGDSPESEAFRVRFRGANDAGTYRAKLRIVTQAGRVGVESQGKEDEPMKGLWYLDIPLEAVVN